jgi:aromatic-L-amino-acid decarboxylase
MIRNHVTWSEELCVRLESEPDFEIVTQPILSLFTFRYTPIGEGVDLDEINRNLVDAINHEGRIYLTQSIHEGVIVIRFMTGQFDMAHDDINIAFDVIVEVARGLKPME